MMRSALLLLALAVPVQAQIPAADSSAALHLLNRLTFGPRPGDIEQVQRSGIAAWLSVQLAPRSIPDPVQDQVRRDWDLAFESPGRLYQMFPPQQLNQQNRNRDSMMAPPQPRPDEMRGRRALGAHVQMATLARHVGSERQLQEVMTDFWFNHFNVFMGKQAARWLTADFVERAIRPNALGSFAELLEAVARHPAMLVYLDNAQSIAPGSRPPAMRRRAMQRLPEQVQRQMPQGLNENYARELLELHTLGVDGGYTQSDVQNVARILTGWSVEGPQRGRMDFEYRDWAHDRGEKVVLGERFPAGRGMDEGQRLLRLLAAHPATAHHIAAKLCTRFVADEPPDGCVDQAAAAFRRSDGNIAATLRAVVSSPDFWADVNRRNKVKSPLEFLAGALRAIGARPDTTPRLAIMLQQLGQPLYLRQVPTGWPETMTDWVNSGALLSRMNMAVGLASGRGGITVNLDSLVPLGSDLVERVNAVVLSGQGSDNTLRVIRAQIADLRDSSAARVMAIGLALGSPEFQRQ